MTALTRSAEKPKYQIPGLTLPSPPRSFKRKVSGRPGKEHYQGAPVQPETGRRFDFHLTFYAFHKPGKFAMPLQQPAAFGIDAVSITRKSRLVVAAAEPPPKSRQRSRISAKLRKQRPGNARPLDAVWLGRKRGRRNNARLHAVPGCPGCSPCARAVRTSSPRVDTT